MTSASLARARPATVFGAQPRPPRPFLLMIVFGLLLVIVGVTATAQSVLVTLHITTATLNATLSSDAATIRTFVNGTVAPADLTPDAAPARIAAVEAGLRSLAAGGELLRIEIRDPGGVVRVSSDPSARGLAGATTGAFKRALGGATAADIVDPADAGDAVGPPLGVSAVLREYLPLIGEDGHVAGVVAIWRNGGPILAEIDRVRQDVLIVTLTAAAIVTILSYLIFRAAQRRITTQQEQLLSSTRRDGLTGMPNHGTVVGDVARAIDAARAAGSHVAVALVDLDSFRLVNDTYGHAAGDRALCQLAEAVTAALPAGAIAGRYGPDEFLLLHASADGESLEPTIDAIRALLDAQNLAVEAGERIPITISAGIAEFPADAASVTELLSMVAVAAAEARASGGNATRLSRAPGDPSFEAGRFDVLQGLVLAVDTKDRYTKRHSEDVARYATFLARVVDLDPGLIEAIRTAGLLHDVGKIGIPDGILRKPGKLTAAEYDVVKQHVALGDAIVRNVPDIDVVRAAIRYHHERWDGQGYLEELAGEAIPIVGRILAVADAFSAMTTTRPYRKALSVEEALRRLADAAGTQLDERLAGAFIRGIETLPDAPLPGETARAGLWAPPGLVA
ncbi:MAG: diguanylate cyclase [Chloroflexi bacterium]|nr:diguanylate cyclase [Chloroflexota bacterium]